MLWAWYILCHLLFTITLWGHYISIPSVQMRKWRFRDVKFISWASWGLSSKESTCNADESSILGSGRSPGGGHGNSLQHYCLENPHGQRSLAGYHPWVCKESDTTEAAEHARIFLYLVCRWENGSLAMASNFKHEASDWTKKSWCPPDLSIFSFKESSG